MAEIHFILQGKGGVGKTMLASMLLQAFLSRGKRCLGIDTDPVNSSLKAFAALPVKGISILEGDETGNIDIRKFDLLLEELINAPSDEVIVVDNGSSSFMAFSTYIRENDLLATLRDAGHSVIFHSIIVGGQGLNDTCKCLYNLFKDFKDPDLAFVWENPFFGPVSRDAKGEHKNLEEFGVIQENMRQIRALVKLPAVNQNLAGRDLQELFARSLTFDEGIAQACTAVRSRLFRYWREVLENMDACGLLPPPQEKMEDTPSPTDASGTHEAIATSTEPDAGEYHE